MGAFRAKLTIIVALLATSLAGGATAQAPQRKNIDLLNDHELAAYEHAIQILKDRSSANSYDKSGYRWQAWVHNCPLIWQPSSGTGAHGDDCDFGGAAPGPDLIGVHPGMCEHFKDLFLIWHRAQLYYFEQILRATDPDGTVRDSRGITGPSTKDVAIPFWNWTRPATGTRYPKAFERDGSPLNHDKRIKHALTPQEKQLLAQVTSANAVAILVYAADWKHFGGDPQEAPTGGAGEFETDHHGVIHDKYVGGDMGDLSRAALDPIFFSFHAYIDLVLAFWLDRHPARLLTSPDHFLRATQPESVAHVPGYVQGGGLPSMGQARIYFDLANVGYGYQVTPPDRLPDPETVNAILADATGAPARFAATAKSRHARLSGAGLFDPATGPATLIATAAVPVPNGAGDIRAAFQRPHDAPDVSFVVDFFLHPRNVDLDLTSKADRERYIVASKGHLHRGGAADHGQHETSKPLYADLTRPLTDLAATGHAGETWTLTAVVSGPTPSPTFGTLSIVP
jgi:tyrosinase